MKRVAANCLFNEKIKKKKPLNLRLRCTHQVTLVSCSPCTVANPLALTIVLNIYICIPSNVRTLSHVLTVMLKQG